MPDRVDMVNPVMMGAIRRTSPSTIAPGENSIPRLPSGPALEMNRKTSMPTSTVGTLYNVWIIVRRSLLPLNRLKCSRQAAGMKISDAIRVAEIDMMRVRNAIENTTGSPEMIISRAIRTASNN
ncbi:MAG: hypothetical protein ABFR50_05610 [Candidatus Fermentibacteria bacterium]